MSEIITNPYHISKIYKIFSPTIDKVYYGATLEKTLRRILSATKSKYNKYTNDNNAVDYNPVFEIFKNDDAEILLVEKFKCEDVDEMKKKLYDYINDPKNQNINNYRPEGYKKPVKKVIKKTQKGGKLNENLTETVTMTETDHMPQKKDINVFSSDIKPILKSVKLPEEDKKSPNTDENIKMFSLHKLLLPQLIEKEDKEVTNYSIGGKTYNVKDGYITIGDNHIEISKLETYSFEKRLKVLKHFEDKLNV